MKIRHELPATSDDVSNSNRTTRDMFLFTMNKQLSLVAIKLGANSVDRRVSPPSAIVNTHHASMGALNGDTQQKKLHWHYINLFLQNVYYCMSIHLR
jgi:hypothetical protein